MLTAFHQLYLQEFILGFTYFMPPVSYKREMHIITLSCTHTGRTPAICRLRSTRREAFDRAYCRAAACRFRLLMPSRSGCSAQLGRRRRNYFSISKTTPDIRSPRLFIGAHTHIFISCGIAMVTAITGLSPRPCHARLITGQSRQRLL